MKASGGRTMGKRLVSVAGPQEARGSKLRNGAREMNKDQPCGVVLGMLRISLFLPRAMKSH